MATYTYLKMMNIRIRGAMVARLTPDPKVACSIYVGFKLPNIYQEFFSEFHYEYNLV